MENNKNFNCRYCNKKYKSINSRWFHEKNKHNKEKIDKKENNNNLDECCFCKKTFVNKYSKNRHIKICKNKDIIVENIKPKNQIQNINITINNNKSIIINSYKEPDISNFSLLDICNIFDEEFNHMLKLIEITYFNNKLKENHCFFVSNLKGDHVSVLKDNIQTIELKKYFFDEIFNVSLVKIKKLYLKYKNKLFENEKQIEIEEKIKAFENLQYVNVPTYKSYIKLINILAYNKKNIIQDTWLKDYNIKNIDDYLI